MNSLNNLDMQSYAMGFTNEFIHSNNLGVDITEITKLYYPKALNLRIVEGVDCKIVRFEMLDVDNYQKEKVNE